MEIRGASAIAIFCLSAALLCSCSQKNERAAMAAQTPVVSPSPKPKPLVAFLREGNLCAIQSDGMNLRTLAAAPENEAIQDFIWALDGSRIYFSIGLQFFEVVIQTGNVANAGELTAPPGVAVDRLEMGRDGKTIIVHALDANASPRLMALTVGHRESRDLTIDEYNALIQTRSPVVRNVGDLSVSPDTRRVLFKRVDGTGEE
jgi:hypothetical protein